MIVAVVNNYTTSELNKIKLLLGRIYVNLANKVTNYYIFGVETDCLYILQELYLYIIVLNDWQQNDNGTTEGKYNRITQEQLNNIVVRIKQLA